MSENNNTANNEFHIKYNNNKMRKKIAAAREFSADAHTLLNMSNNNQTKKERQRRRQMRIENAKIKKASTDEMAKALYYLGHETKNPGALIPPPRKKQLEGIKHEIQSLNEQLRI